MTNKKQIVERRKHKRFQVQDGGSVVLRAHSIELGQIIDVSRGGLGFRYIPSQQPSSRLFELVILLADGSFYLDEIPFKIVSDFETNDDPFTFSTIRRCGVQFGKLTRGQVSQLEYFILNHTINGTHVNHSGEVPRETVIQIMVPKARDLCHQWSHHTSSTCHL